MIDPRLQIAFRKTVDMYDIVLVFTYIVVEVVLMVDGIFPIMGPAAAVKDESRGLQYVPPTPFVRRMDPEDMNNPVFESTAKTLRRTTVSDISSSYTSVCNYLENNPHNQR